MLNDVIIVRSNSLIRHGPREFLLQIGADGVVCIRSTSSQTIATHDPAATLMRWGDESGSLSHDLLDEVIALLSEDDLIEFLSADAISWTSSDLAQVWSEGLQVGEAHYNGTLRLFDRIETTYGGVVRAELAGPSSRQEDGDAQS